jgi:hypothetical protein|tara:strand:+ start:41 stop:202 length:162 start_codon:yes stop_codon:yes gene_type:complete
MKKLKVGDKVGMMKVVRFENGKPVFKTTNPDTLTMLNKMISKDLTKVKNKGEK